MCRNAARVHSEWKKLLKQMKTINSEASQFGKSWKSMRAKFKSMFGGTETDWNIAS